MTRELTLTTDHGSDSTDFIITTETDGSDHVLKVTITVKSASAMTVDICSDQAP